MIAYEFEVHGLDEQLAKLDGYARIANRALESAMHKSVITIENNVKPLVPVGVSGRLRGSITSRVTTEMGSVVGRVGSNLTREVYPSVMEFGRRPGAKMPPPSALERWVRLVLRVPPERVKGTAYVVARAIARRGIKGRRFLQKGYEKSRLRVAQYFQTALDEIAEGLSVE